MRRVEFGMITSEKSPELVSWGKMRSPVIELVTDSSTVAVSWTLPALLIRALTEIGVVREKPGIELSRISPE